MSDALDLLASVLGSLRRVGLLLAAVGVAVLVAVASGSAAGGAHRIGGGTLLQLDRGSAVTVDATAAP